MSSCVLLQHYDRRSPYDTAVAKIDEAISHTPTVIDLYSVKVCIPIVQRHDKLLNLVVSL